MARPTLLRQLTWNMVDLVSTCRLGQDCTPFAAQTLRDVAAWLRSQGDPAAHAWAMRLEQEAIIVPLVPTSGYPVPGIDACDCKGIVGDCGVCDNSCRTNGLRQ